MKLVKKISQYRRDFTGLFKCEHCGHEIKRPGYDDTYFMLEVIPNMECSKCGKKGSLDVNAVNKISVPENEVI